MLKIILLLGALFSLALYFVPTIIACYRNHARLPAIVALNIFLGWTFVGWIGALVWAFAGRTLRSQANG
jgi:hypothetical protein